MSFEQNNLIRAVDMIASISPRVHAHIWSDNGINLDFLRGYEYKCRDNTFSGSENAAYEFAISLWNGEAKIELDDILLFDDRNYVKVIKALMILRGIGKVEIGDEDKRLKGPAPVWMRPASERPKPSAESSLSPGMRAIRYLEGRLRDWGDDLEPHEREAMVERINALREKEGLC